MLTAIRDNGKTYVVVDAMRFHDPMVIVHFKDRRGLPRERVLRNDGPTARRMANAARAKHHWSMVRAIAAYDRKQESKPGFNRYALPQYIAALESVESDLKRGATIEQAAHASFNQPLAGRIIKAYLEAQ